MIFSLHTILKVTETQVLKTSRYQDSIQQCFLNSTFRRDCNISVTLISVILSPSFLFNDGLQGDSASWRRPVGVSLLRAWRRQRMPGLQVCAAGSHRWKPDNELGGESLASCCTSAATGPDVCVWRATILRLLPDDVVYHKPCGPTSANAFRHCVGNQYFASLAWQPQLHRVFLFVFFLHASLMLALKSTASLAVCVTYPEKRR